MADEIKISGSLVFNRNTDPLYKESISFSKQIDQAAVMGEHYSSMSQEIGFAAEENLDKGEITTVGWFILKNLDDTNFVTLGTVTGQLPIKVKPGAMVGPVSVSATNIIAQADTAAVKVQFLLVEE